MRVSSGGILSTHAVQPASLLIYGQKLQIVLISDFRQHLCCLRRIVQSWMDDDVSDTDLSKNLYAIRRREPGQTITSIHVRRWNKSAVSIKKRLPMLRGRKNIPPISSDGSWGPKGKFGQCLDV